MHLIPILQYVFDWNKGRLSPPFDLLRIKYLIWISLVNFMVAGHFPPFSLFIVRFGDNVWPISRKKELEWSHHAKKMQ